LALNFPDNPTIDQIYSDSTAGFYYRWDGVVWQSYSPSSSSNIKVLDDISSQFTGIAQTFGLTSGGVAVIPVNAGQVVINLGGVIQDPSDDYSVNGSNIIFSSAPEIEYSFSGISLGSAIPLTDLPARSIAPDKLTVGAPAWQSNYNVGIGTTLPTSALNVIGNANITGVITATTFDGNATSAYYASIAGYSTNAVNATNATYATNSINVSSGIASVAFLNVSGISTLGQTIVGGATTQLVVQGNARITGILTIGTASITFDGTSNTGTIGTTRIVSLASGIKTLFHEATAPTGWTKVTSHNDKTLRVVSGNGGGSGGSSAFTSVFASRTPSGSVSVSGSNSGGSVTGSVSGSNSGGSVNNTTLSTSEIPSHQHSFSQYNTANGTAAGSGRAGALTASDNTGGTGGGGSHGHGFNNPSWSGSWSQSTFTNPSWSGSGSFSGSAMDFDVQYIDMILCSIN
jgi:hypothetical protein